MSILRLRMALPALILAGSTACDRSVQPNQIVVRDSAGVQIAEFDWTAVPTAWQVDSIAEWSVGANDQAGERLELHEVRDAMILGDGSVVIAEGSSQEVIWAGPRGELVSRIGGRGDGPDQFRDISKVFDDGSGGIFIFDSTRKRSVRLNREGALLQEATAPAEIGTILASHRTGGGWYLLSNGPFEETGIYLPFCWSELKG